VDSFSIKNLHYLNKQKIPNESGFFVRADARGLEPFVVPAHQRPVEDRRTPSAGREDAGDLVVTPAFWAAGGWR